MPIVAFTAYATPDFREQAEIAGMDGFLTKPISKESLMKTIYSIVPPPGSEQTQH
jgi:CheY-like chemotaxis protein